MVVVAVLFESVEVVFVVVFVLVEVEFVEFVDYAGVAAVSFEASVNCSEVVEFYESCGSEITSCSSLLPPLFVVSVVVVFVELAAFSS